MATLTVDGINTLVHPQRGQRVKNDRYERVLEQFNGHLGRVAFPVSRNR